MPGLSREREFGGRHDPYALFFPNREVREYVREFVNAVVSVVPSVLRVEAMSRGEEGSLPRIVVFHNLHLSEDLIEVIRGLRDLYGRHHITEEPLFEDVGLRHVGEGHILEEGIFVGVLWYKRVRRRR